jgi:prolipoprotein diacylglyceryl transferase
MLIHWSVSPEIFSLGPFHLRWYGLMFLLGFTIGYQGMAQACRWENKPVEKLDSMLMHLVLGTTIGARLGHVIFYDPVYYFSNPIEIFKIWEGGLASHGGAAGVVIAMWLFCRKNKEFNFLWLCDRIAIFTVLAGCFIRIGNLMNSEILGKPTDGTWGVIFEHVDHLPRHPAMIYESIAYLLIFISSYFLYRRWRETTPRGFIFGFVLALIFVARFIIEFWKENQSPFEAHMIINMGQCLSIPCVIIGVWMMWRAWKRGFEPKLTSKPTGKKKALKEQRTQS